MSDIINSRMFKTISYYRKKKSPGGGCAIVYDKKRFCATDPEIAVPDNVETVWSVLTPASGTQSDHKVKRIAVASVYVSPKSKYKSEQ